jgi:glycyl-tRNA synthetase
MYKASGHLANFSDPLIDCKDCHQRFRADKLIEEFAPDADVSEASSFDKLEKVIADYHIKCPNCGKEN